MDETQQNLVSYIVLLIIIVFIILIIIYYVNRLRLVSKECGLMNSLYPANNTYIHSFNFTGPDGSGNLRDYYIKTAFNACSGGSYKNDYVDLCNLKALLRQGVRGIDLEIYSVDNTPVVSTSTQDNNYYVKETFNSIPFYDVMDILTNYAFSGSMCPNPKDPLLLHLRIKSAKSDLYDKLADIFKTFTSFMLGKEYSYENDGYNMGDIPLSKIQGKILLIIDKTNNAFLSNKNLMEYVNMTSNSLFMRLYPYDKVKNTPDMDELTEYNKKNMSIVLPDVTTANASPSNPSGIVCRAMGCQMVAMIYQKVDEYLEENNGFFDMNGSAFVLKPEALRYIPVVLPDPVPQNPQYSYATRTISKDYYKFNV